MAQEPTPEQIRQAVASYFADAPATEADAAREAIAAEEAAAQESPPDAADAWHEAIAEMVAGDRQAHAAQIEAGRQAWAALGLDDEETLAKWLTLSRTEREQRYQDTLTEQGVPTFTDLRYRVAKLTGQRAAVEAIERARETPAIVKEDIVSQWFDGGRNDLAARAFGPGFRPAEEVERESDREYRIANRLPLRADQLEPETAPQPRTPARTEEDPDPFRRHGISRDGLGRFMRSYKGPWDR